MFPSLFQNRDKMLAEFSAHLRYPEDIFQVQTLIWARYHVNTPEEYFLPNSRWDVARRETTTPVVDAARATGSGNGDSNNAQLSQLNTTDTSFVDPNYALTRLPGDGSLSWVLMRPFVVNKRQEMP